MACKTRVQSQVELYQRLPKMHLLLPCLIQHYKVRFKSKVEKSGVRSSPYPYTALWLLLKRERSCRPRLRSPTLLYDNVKLETRHVPAVDDLHTGTDTYTTTMSSAALRNSRPCARLIKLNKWTQVKADTVIVISIWSSFQGVRVMRYPFLHMVFLREKRWSPGVRDWGRDWGEMEDEPRVSEYRGSLIIHWRLFEVDKPIRSIFNRTSPGKLQ